MIQDYEELPTYINTGTVTLVNGSNIVTGTGSNWKTLGSVRPGDILWSPLDGYTCRIEEVVSDTSLKLAYNWAGQSAANGAYEIRITPEAVRVQEATRRVLASLANGQNFHWVVACSAETGTFVAAPGVVTLPVPYDSEVFALIAFVKTPAVGQITVDVNINGISMLSTKLTIDAGEQSSLTAAIPAVISHSLWAQGDVITIDIDVASSGAAALKVVILGKQADQ